MTKTQPPLPLKPARKLKDPAASRANQLAYLTKTELAWIAGVYDSIGKVNPHRILRAQQEQKFLNYRVTLRSSPKANAALERLSEMLRVKLRNNARPDGTPKYEVWLPQAMTDDFFAILKPYLTAESYNVYVRSKYLSELSAFKLEEAGWDYSEGMLRGKPTQKLYKGVDWGKLDELLKAPELVPTDLKHIKHHVDIVNLQVNKYQEMMEDN